MTKFDHRMILLLTGLFLVAIVIKEPYLVSDQNKLLKEFVSDPLLSFMGLIVTITLASTANIHLILRKMEKDAGREFLTGTKRAVRRSAFSLIWALVLSIILVTIKGSIPTSHDTAIAAINSLAILTCLGGISVILDITRLALKI